MFILLYKQYATFLGSDSLAFSLQEEIKNVNRSHNPEEQEALISTLEKKGLAGIKALFWVMRSCEESEKKLASTIALAIRPESFSSKMRNVLAVFLNNYINNPDSPIDDSLRTAVLMLAKMKKLKLI
jgi:hypothetical protein